MQIAAPGFAALFERVVPRLGPIQANIAQPLKGFFDLWRGWLARGFTAG
jgi:hypothetical protein